MDQEATLDFKALKAKFQDEDLCLKQPKLKPALPEKPKVVLPPHSPTHNLPAGARPSLLTSINHSLEGKTEKAPRVVFKDEKDDSINPLIQVNSKGKDKREGKLKKGKDKTKRSKEKLDEDSSDQKQKKENSKDKKLPLIPSVAPKESTAELVPAMPPPKATSAKQKGFLGFRKSSKRGSLEVTADPIIDTSSSDIPGPAPLIPVPADICDVPPEPEVSAPKELLPNIPALRDSSAAEQMILLSTIPASPDFTPPPAFIPDFPAPKVPSPMSASPLEIKAPSLPVSRPATQNEITPSPPSAVPTPQPSHDISGSSRVASTPSPSPPEPEFAAEAGIEAVNIAAVEKPPPPVADPPSILSSSKTERPISALSVLERAVDMNPGKRNPADQRILNALEKARKKTTSPLKNPTTSYSITPPQEAAPPQSPTHSLLELPPIDYEDRAGKALPLKPAQVNGFDHRQSSPVLEGITEEGSVPVLLVVPPPPPRKVLPVPESRGPAPQKPERPPSVNLSEFIPPSLVEDKDIHAPPEFSKTYTTDVSEFDASHAHPPELPASEWGIAEYMGPDTPNGQNVPECYSNGMTTPGAEVHAAPVFGVQDNPQLESSFPISQESPPQAGLQGDVDNDAYESTENVYEDIAMSVTKKRGKTEGGKKRKGPPKNPYAEAAQETNEEKSKTGRFGKSDKKAAAEGPEEKELKKKEKQRLEKEKKELKEKQEREKKEQKEREKKENEMKKKFEITGQEDAIYEAKVTVTTKGRKNDLPVKSGDIISIIRTTNCPKGKWLAKDSSNNYGYVAVDRVALDIKEMLELGMKAAINRKSNSHVTEAEAARTESRASNHYPISAESFTDDSEEWSGDDEPLSPHPDAEYLLAPMGHTRTLSMPDMGNKDLSVNHQHSHSDMSADGSHVHSRNEALQKLATFFHSPKPVEPAASAEPETSPVLVKAEAVHPPKASSTQKVDFDQTDMPILPPPDLYADLTME